MPGTQNPGGDTLLHRRWQVKQPECVGNMRARAADLLGKLFVRGPEIIEELLISGGLFQGVKLLPVQVLDQCVAQEVGVGGFADDRGDQLEVGALAGPPPALAHNQLVAAGHHLAHHDRLQEAYLADGRRQLIQRLLVEGTPWLTRVGSNRAGGQFFEVGAGNRLSTRSTVVSGQSIRCERATRPRARLGFAGTRPGTYRCRDKRTEPLAEPAPLLSHRISSIHTV